MRIVLDTNVFVSGIFFSGPPYRILHAWREGRVDVVYSPAIIFEYRRVLAELSEQFPNINAQPFLDFVTRYGELIHPGPTSGVSCRDPDDVKFLECFLSSKANCLVTGDKDLLEVRTKAALILTPRQFCDRYL
jgi:putative PIN family toxin of toxin-antitoxin system